MSSFNNNNNNNNNGGNFSDDGEIDTDNLRFSELDNMEHSITQTEEEIIINKKKIFYGVLVVIGIGISWASSTQFAQHVQVRTNVTIPPFALMWFATTFKIFCAVPVLIAYYKQHKNPYIEMETPQSVSTKNRSHHLFGTKHPHKTVSEIFNAEEYTEETESQYGTTNKNKNNKQKQRTLSRASKNNLKNRNNDIYISDVTPNNRRMCALYLLFYFLWTGANYCYYRALHSNSATIVTAIFSSNNMFIYVLSIFVLTEIFSILRMIAVITAILGICFIALNNKDSQIALIGSMLALISSIFAAFYKVYFKKIFGNMHVLNVCKFLGFIGLFNGLFMWIVIVILDGIGWEKLPKEPLNEWPWSFLVGTALCGLTFDFLINFGIAFTYPLFIALGIIIGIPFNLIADIVFNKLMIGAYEMIGILCICAGFMIIVLTDLHGKGANASFRK